MKTGNKRNLGKHGPLVSALGLGCMHMSNPFGGKAGDEAESMATTQAELENLLVVSVVTRNAATCPVLTPSCHCQGK